MSLPISVQFLVALSVVKFYLYTELQTDAWVIESWGFRDDGAGSDAVTQAGLYLTL